ncbi:hypothetical protein JW848_03905 [Candidatus Bipolaricaulota bacterium]|nr:hypothetical protein [Candidatus Bipolaricaulota bacterium]
MKLSFWSDEARWFTPRAFGLGYSLNLKHAAKRLGLIKAGRKASSVEDASTAGGETIKSESREDRLRRQIETSRFEDHR